jgi:hypothetical protein
MLHLHAFAATALLTQAATEDGLSLSEILSALPTDPASLFVLILVLGFGGATVYFGKRSGKP